jgi:hypothetical protein
MATRHSTQAVLRRGTRRRTLRRAARRQLPTTRRARRPARQRHRRDSRPGAHQRSRNCQSGSDPVLVARNGRTDQERDPRLRNVPARQRAAHAHARQSRRHRTRPRADPTDRMGDRHVSRRPRARRRTRDLGRRALPRLRDVQGRPEQQRIRRDRCLRRSRSASVRCSPAHLQRWRVRVPRRLRSRTSPTRHRAHRRPSGQPPRPSPVSNGTIAIRNNRLAHMYLRNGQRRPETNAALQHWLDIADTVANSIPTSSGYSPHELLFAQRRIVSVAALVPDDMLRAIADIGTDATTDLVSQIRLHQAALAVLDEARQDARIQQRAAIERAHGQQHAAPHVWQRGDLVLARTPHALRDGDDKLNSRLEFSGVWSVMSHDPVTRTSRSASHDSSTDIERCQRATGPHARRHEHDHRSLVRRSQFPRRPTTRRRSHGQSAAHRRRTTGAQRTVARTIHRIRRRCTNCAHGADQRAPNRRQAPSHTRTRASRFGQPRPRDSSTRSTRSARSATSCGGGCFGRRGGEHSSTIPNVVPEQAVRSATTSTRAPRSPTIASTGTHATRTSNRSSARKRFFYTGDTAGPFVEIEGISDDGLVVHGYVNMIDGRRTDGLVPVDRRFDDLCREDAALLARYRSPGE